MNKFSRGLVLVKESWAVLKENPRLLALPALSFTALLLVFAVVATPFVLKPQLLDAISRTGQDQSGHHTTPVFMYIGLGLFYFAMNFVIVFFNVALISIVIARFEGRTATLGDGLRAAASRIPQIMAWAAIAATVGVLLKMLEERVPALGKIVVRLIGFAWGVVTYFVVPILAFERLGPIESIKRSGEIIKKTWGESLVGALGLGALTFLLMIPGFVIIGFGFYRTVNTRPDTNFVPFFVSLGFGAAYFIVVGLITSALKQIFIASAYLYGSRGQLTPGFSEESMTGAFTSR